MKKILKLIIIIFSILIIVVIAGGFIAGNYFFNIALNSKTDKSVILSAEHNQMPEASPEELNNAKQYIKSWLDNTGYEDLYVKSFDDLQLHSYSIPNSAQTNKWVILCHGYGGFGYQMISTGIKFYDMGFNLLIPDARGAGSSEGDYIGMGWHDRLDVIEWINEIISKDSSAQIILYGISMGGATVMMVSGEELPSNVRAIVEDCGYSSVWDEFAYQMDGIFGLPSFPVMHFSSAVTKIRANFWLGESSAVKQVSKSVTPILFIHGDADTFVPSYMIDELYDAANCPKGKIVVPGAGHGESSNILGDKYWEAVEIFVEQYLD